MAKIGLSMNVQVCANQKLKIHFGSTGTWSPFTLHPLKCQFKETLAYKNGRYEVSLPWKDGQVVLKDDYKQARSRLYNLEKNLLQDSSKAKSYQEAINKYMWRTE